MGGDRSPEDYFGDDAEGLALYRAVAEAVEANGEAEVKVTKSQIAFRRRKGFAFVWRPAQYVNSDVPVVLSIALPEELRSERFKEVVHPSAKAWMHHLEIREADEIDHEVRTWLATAYREAA
ncbi:DUF5655 domain-containing protein [Glycomyces tritici]|uniref:DUF5655 domain-containing protein n=1 Tax=Glycomyces tritici TaxID=2665176 RepID=A0ABT7YIW6_9ACTN|nr:DUF5655 domain-containing protein [Glycomyces tritici]MDN3238565.1 DUF5655 domain-containing protein [Glycomyces tritici]